MLSRNQGVYDIIIDFALQAVLCRCIIVLICVPTMTKNRLNSLLRLKELFHHTCTKKSLLGTGQVYADDDV